ncbi:hypothetical protein EDM68_05260 [Candidatus Uhrbacteria bacterium]|nr:MAG: hypothetical protein EDM68_05260 [Candidatus Uhrbacteria bacterium]
MNEHLSTCEYCRCSGDHQPCCPEGDTASVQIWKAGFQAGLNGQRNTRADDQTYSLGFSLGEEERERINAHDKKLRMFPEEAPESRPSHAPVSTSEFCLIVQDIRSEPPPIPAVDPLAAFQRELAARDRDIY